MPRPSSCPDDARRAPQHHGTLQRRLACQGRGGGCCLRARGAPFAMLLAASPSVGSSCSSASASTRRSSRLHGACAGGVGRVVVPFFRCREPSWRRGRWQKDLVPTRTPLPFRCRHGLFHLAAFPMGLRIRVEGGAPATHSAATLGPSLSPVPGPA